MIKSLLQAPLGTSEGSSTPTPTVYTPSRESSPQGSLSSRPPSRRPSPFKSLKPTPSSPSPSQFHQPNSENEPHEGRLLIGRDPNSYSRPDWDEEGEMDERPPMHRPGDGRSQMPLLKEDRGRQSYDSPNGSARPPFHARRSTFRSKSPDIEGLADTRKKYTYAAFFLVLSLISFVVQTETAVYIQHELGWNKAYCML